MWTLLRKELRAQLPFFLLILFLLLTSVLFYAISQPLTLVSTELWFKENVFELDSEFSIIAFILSFALASGLLVREFDDSTIEFMDALPVSRTQWFFAKWLSAMLCLATLPVVDSMITLVVHAISRTSLDRGWHIDWLVTSVMLQLCLLFCFLSVGMALSFLRRFGWLVVGLILWLFFFLGELHPRYSLSNWLLLPEPEFVGKRWLVPWHAVTAQLVLGGASLLVAYTLFLGGGQTLLKWFGASSSRLKQTVLSGTSIVIVLVFAVWMVLSSGPELDEDGADGSVHVVYPSWSTASRATSRFDAVFPANMSTRANRLLDDADEIYATVATFLGDKTSARVQIDMTGVSGYHLGTAYWQKLNLNLFAHEDQADLRRTLGHESTHVILENLANNQLQEHFSSVRFFHEGVATYVERRFFGEPDDVNRLRLGAAVQHARGEVEIDRLIDNDRLRAEHDTTLVYDLGEVFAAAVVRRYGDESLAKLARTFAEKRHTEGLQRTPLWRSVFQASGYSLNEATGEFYELLRELTEVHAAEIDKLPKIQAVVDVDDSLVTIRPDEAAPPGWEIIVRFRSSRTADDNDYWDRVVGDPSDATFAVKSQFTSRTCWYSLGYRKRGLHPIFQPWQKVQLD